MKNTPVMENTSMKNRRTFIEVFKNLNKGPATLLAVLATVLVLSGCPNPIDPIIDPTNTLETQSYTASSLSDIVNRVIDAQGLDRSIYDSANIIDSSDGKFDISTSGGLDPNKIDQIIAYIDNIINEIDANQFDGTFNFDIHSAAQAVLDIELTINEAEIVLTSEEITALNTKLAELRAKIAEYNAKSTTTKNISLDETDIDEKVTEDENPGDGRTLMSLPALPTTPDWAALFSELDGLTTTFNDGDYYGFELEIPVSWTQVSLDAFGLGGPPAYADHDIVSEYRLSLLRDNLETLQDKLDAITGSKDVTNLDVMSVGSSTLDIDYDGSTVVDASQGQVDTAISAITTIEGEISAIFSGTPVTMNYEDIDSVTIDILVPAIQDIDLSTSTSGLSNGDGLLTASEITAAEGQDGVNLGTLQFSGLTGLSGTFTIAEMAKVKKYCITQGSYSSVNTDNCFVDFDGASIDQADIESFFTNTIGYAQITELHIADADWDGDFRVSPSTATATEVNLRDKVFLDGSSTSITSLTIKLANDLVVMDGNTTFHMDYNPGQFANVLYDQLGLASFNSADKNNISAQINIDASGNTGTGYIVENIMDGYVNSDGSSRGVQLSDISWTDTEIIPHFIGGSIKKVSSVIINDIASMPESMFDTLKDVHVVGTTPLTITTDQDPGYSEVIDGVLFDCPVDSDFSGANFDGTIVFNDGIAGSTLDVYCSGGTSQAIIINGDLTGASVGNFRLSGTLDITEATGEMTGTVNYLNHLRSDDGTASNFATTTGVGSQSMSNSTTYNSGSRATVLAAVNTKFGTTVAMLDDKTQEDLPQILNGNDRERMA